MSERDVLILCQYFYPEPISSATLPTELAKDLKSKGLSVDVLCGYPTAYKGQGLKQKESINGITVQRLRYVQLDDNYRLGRLVNFLSFSLSMVLKIPRMWTYKCIVVYSNPPVLPFVPYLVNRVAGTPFVFVVFDVYPDVALLVGAIREGSVIHRIMSFINSKVYASAAAVITLGNEMKQYLIDSGIAVNPKTMHVIPNWFSASIDDAEKVKAWEFLQLRRQWPFIVLYGGNMGTCQDMDTILRGLYLLRNDPDILFVFAGHGNKVGLVKEYIHNNEISNVRVYGFLPHDVYADALRISDVCLVSLERSAEGLGVPSKTYGYLAAGKPVLAIMSSDTDIVRDLRAYGAGAAVPQGDSEGLASKLLQWKQDPDLLARMGISARELSDARYRRSACTEKYATLVRRVIGRSSEIP